MARKSFFTINDLAEHFFLSPSTVRKRITALGIQPEAREKGAPKEEGGRGRPAAVYGLTEKQMAGFYKSTGAGL